MKEVIYLASIGVMLQNFEHYQKLLDKVKLNRKPFNCTLCGTFWMSLVYFLFQDYSLLTILGLSASGGILAELVDRQLNDF